VSVRERERVRGGDRKSKGERDRRGGEVVLVVESESGGEEKECED
jgi:hypothetical protein